MIFESLQYEIVEVDPFAWQAYLNPDFCIAVQLGIDIPLIHRATLQSHDDGQAKTTPKLADVGHLTLGSKTRLSTKILSQFDTSRLVQNQLNDCGGVQEVNSDKFQCTSPEEA